MRGSVRPIRRERGVGSIDWKSSTWDPFSRRRLTASSRVRLNASRSTVGRRTSLVPPARLTSSGASSSAVGTCSATIAASYRPRTARLAYWKAGLQAASSSATRSAHPRNRPLRVVDGSHSPSVKLSPRATKLDGAGTALTAPASMWSTGVILPRRMPTSPCVFPAPESPHRAANTCPRHFRPCAYEAAPDGPRHSSRIAATP